MTSSQEERILATRFPLRLVETRPACFRGSKRRSCAYPARAQQPLDLPEPRVACAAGRRARAAHVGGESGTGDRLGRWWAAAWSEVERRRLHPCRLFGARGCRRGSPASFPRRLATRQPAVPALDDPAPFGSADRVPARVASRPPSRELCFKPNGIVDSQTSEIEEMEHIPARL